MFEKLLNFCRGEKGQAIVEYALVLALVVVVIAAVLGSSPLGDVVAEQYNNVAELFSDGQEIP